MRLTLHRFLSDDEGTLGIVTRDGVEVCRMLELPWRGNRSNVSCIPAGRYRVYFLPLSSSGRYRDVYHVTNVPGRGGILIHPGNFAGDSTRGLHTDSWGCMLPAQRFGRLLGQRAGLVSRGALDRIHAVTGRQGFELEVIGGMAQ